MALSLVAPVLANPPEDKFVADLKDSDDRVGQVIFNTHDEDNNEAEMYELEVEVEESELEDGTYAVYLGATDIGDISIVDGNGKTSIDLDSSINLGSDIITVGTDGLASDPSTERLWVQGKGKK